MEIEVDYNKALDMTQRLIEATRQKNKYPFNITCPDTIIPEGIKLGSKEHSILLFNSISLDSNERSDLIYKKVIALSRRVKGLERIAEIEEHRLKSHILSTIGKTTSGNSLAKYPFFLG